MRSLSQYLRCVVVFAQSRPAAVAALLSVVSFAWVFAHGVPTLQNDDIQIQFLLLDGGLLHPSTSVYTHAWLGAWIRWATRLFPAVSWYLVFQAALLFLASFYAAFFVCANLLSRLRKNVVSALVGPTVLLFVFFWITRLLTNLQYTSTAIFAACCASVALYFFARKPSISHAGAVLVLLCGAGALRPACLLPAFFMAAGLAFLIRMTGSSTESRRYLIGLVGVVLAASGLYLSHRASNRALPSGEETAAYLQARVSILDYPDRSGVDKTESYLQLGVSPNDVALFQGFQYHPAWDSLSLARKALAVHREHQPGLFGKYSFDVAKFSALAPDLVRATPWVTLGYILLVPLLFFGRWPTRKQMCILLPFGCILVAIVATGRPVGRVYEPVLACTTLLAGGLMPLCRENQTCLRLRTLLLILVTAACLLFAFRHYRHGSIVRPTAPGAYCTEHGDWLFFTLSIQNSYCLYPDSIACSPAEQWRNANLVPIGDGWLYYTPAFRRYLAERGIADPYRTLLENRSRLLTYTPHEKSFIFQRLRTLYRERYGVEVDFVREAEVPPCRIWRVVASPVGK